MPVATHLTAMHALTQRALRVEPLDFESIYDAHIEFAWRLLERFGVPTSQVEDAAQDCFLIVHRQLATFRHASTVKTWIGGICVRVAKDYRRRVKRKGGAESLDDALEVPDRASTPELKSEAAEAFRTVLSIVDTFDDVFRDVFVLAELEELSAPEIAELLSVPVNTVYSRLRIARERFNVALELRRGGER